MSAFCHFEDKKSRHLLFQSWFLPMWISEKDALLNVSIVSS